MFYGEDYSKVNAYELTYRRLEEKGFKQYKESVLEHLGVAVFHKEHLSIIIQNLELGMGIKDIKQESIRIRERLHQIKMNVWNTYYILCAGNENVYREDLFFIERDSTGLRKYVVIEEADLNRIPFLDNLPVNVINNPIRIEGNLTENDTTIKNLYEFIQLNNGSDKIIPEKEINNFIDTFLEEDKN